MNVFLVICDLDDKRNIKSLLQVFCKDERNRMPHMECISRWSSSCIKVERIILFVLIKNNVKISLTEEDSTSDKSMSRFFSQTLYFLNHGRFNLVTTKFFNELIVINSSFSCSLDSEGCNFIITFILFNNSNFFFLCFNHWGCRFYHILNLY